jgi:hypothetical protein
MGDEARRTPVEDEAWKNKVKSLDDTLKSLRDAGAKGKAKGSKPPASHKQPGRGLFSFLQPRPGPRAIPVEET